MFYICYGMRHFHMFCSMCVYYLNVFCLSFVSETKALYGVLLYVQLKRRQGISVNVFRALLNSLQSVANLLHERQSVVACVSNVLSYQSKSNGNQSKSAYWYSLIALFTAQKVYKTVSCSLFICFLQAFSCSKSTQ